MQPPEISVYANWRVRTAAKSEQAARRVLVRVTRALSVPILDNVDFRYYEGEEYWLHFKIRLEGSTWEEMLVHAMELGQRIGYAWTVHGDVRREVTAWCDRAAVVGVEWLEWTLARVETPG